MEITIKTKFGLTDRPYGYYNGKIWQFMIDAIKVNFNTSYSYNEVIYECTAIVPDDYDCTFHHTFVERELHTKEEFADLVASLK